MDDQRGQAVARFFNTALEMTESRRAAYLNVACCDDEVLRHAVESLLVPDGGVSAEGQPYFVRGYIEARNRPRQGGKHCASSPG